MLNRLLALAALCLALAAPAWAQPEPTFEIPVLNEGLGEAPAGIDRETAQATMEQFLDYAADGDWTSAAHLLNLAEIPPADQPLEGPLAAAQLSELIERKIVIAWSQLLDRPDQLDTSATSNSAVAGQAIRSIVLGVLDLEDRSVPIRLDRVEPQGGDPVWVFSRQSVENVPALYALYGPTWIEQRLPAWAKAESGLLGLSWWELIALPLTIIVAALAGAATYRALRAGERKADGTYAEIVLRSLKWPATIAVVTSVLAIATQSLFVFSATIDAVIGPVIAAGFVIAIVLFTMSVLDGILDQITVFDPEALGNPDDQTARSRATALSAARRVVLVLLVLLGFGWVLSSASLFQTFGFSLLASAGAITIILGFAARRVLGNIISSLQIAFNRSARIGDSIIYQGEWCTVERIHFTYVQLKHWTGNRHVIPVEEFVSEGFENWSLAETEMQNVVKLKLAGTADLAGLRRRFHEIVEAEEEILRKDEAQMIVYSQDALGILVRFQFWTPDASTGWAIECRVREALIVAIAEMERADDIVMFPENAAADAAA